MEIKVSRINSCYMVFDSEISSEDRKYLENEINKEKKEKISGNLITSFYDKKEQNESSQWEKFFIDTFKEKINQVFYQFGYDLIDFKNIWFQKYQKDSTHTWHSHAGANFSIVFYLKMPIGSSKTKLIEPFGLNQIDVDAKEGEFCIFPAEVIHSVQNNNTQEDRIVIVINAVAECNQGTYLQNVLI